MGKYLLSVVAYIVATFALGFGWHLMVFEARYRQLEVYRDELAFPLGIAAMLVQATVYAWAYPRFFANPRDEWAGGALKFALVFGLPAWAYSTLAVAAKHRMSSVGGFLALETGFTVLHFAVIATLIGLVWRGTGGEGGTAPS